MDHILLVKVFHCLQDLERNTPSVGFRIVTPRVIVRVKVGIQLVTDLAGKNESAERGEELGLPHLAMM